jgi:hypothetical protein
LGIHVAEPKFWKCTGFQVLWGDGGWLDGSEKVLKFEKRPNSSKGVKTLNHSSRLLASLTSINIV